MVIQTVLIHANQVITYNVKTGNPTMLRLSSITESKINNNENGFDNIDINVNDNDQLQSLMTDLSVRDDSEQNSFKDDLLNMIDGGQNEVV